MQICKKSGQKLELDKKLRLESKVLKGGSGKRVQKKNKESKKGRTAAYIIAP